MFAVDVCDLPATGGSTFVVIAGLFVLVAGVIVARWVRESAGRLSVVVAPLVLLGGLVLAPQVVDPCAPTTTTTVASTTTTTVAVTTTTVAATTTTVPVTTTVAPVVYIVGDTGPGGGIVFYVDETQPEGSRYFEVACVGWSDGICGGTTADPQAEWGCDGTLISGADGLAIGAGELNTTEILAGCPTAGIAARLANDLTLGGQTDWFLPSKDELNALCKWAYGDNVNAICNDDGYGSFSLTNGGFSSDGYWSSSENVGNYAWLQGFYDGYQTSNSKTNTFYVRPVRAF